jgi:cysteine sulfinate desulfinase/cysteine desulfurase-like protein
MGREPSLASATLRFGIGHANTVAEIEQVAEQVIATVKLLRE